MIQSIVSISSFDAAIIILAYRFEYSLPPNSCDGDPAPNLPLPGALPNPFIPPGLPKGDRIGLFVGASMGDVLVVDDPDFDWFAESWGK